MSESDCCYYNGDNSPFCCELYDNECEAQNCYYKQLQVAIAENNRLKEQIEPCYNPKTGEIEGYLHNITDDFLKSTKLEQENKELKEKMNKINDVAHWRMGDVDIHYQNRLKQIQKLSEV